MTHQAPPVVKLSESVLVNIEIAVRRFPRYHKYAVGSDLREQARRVTRCAHRAWRDQGRRGDWIRRLVFSVDDLKISMQVAKRVHAFKSFNEFEALARLCSNLGRQCGGWQKQHFKGQNHRTSPSAGSAQILSTRDASQEANQ